MDSERENHSHCRQGIIVASNTSKKPAKKSTKKSERKAVETKLAKKLKQAQKALAKEKARAKKLAKMAKDALRAGSKKTGSATAKKVTKSVDAVKDSGRDATKKTKNLIETAAEIVATPAPVSATKQKAPIRQQTTAKTGTAAPRTVRTGAQASAASTQSPTPSETWTLAQLRAKAREVGLSGYSRQDKATLLERFRTR